MRTQSIAQKGIILTVSVVFMLVQSYPCRGETRLLYPQEQAIKKMSAELRALTKKYKTYQYLCKKKTFTMKPEPGLGILDDLKKVETEFKAAKLPADNKKVKDLKSWIDTLLKHTPTMEKVYTEGYNNALKNPQQQAAGDLALPKDYDQDVARLKEMYKNYKNPNSVFRNPAKAKELIPKFQDEYAFFNNLPKKYDALLKAKKAGKIATWIRTNKKYLEKFEAAKDEYAKQLPQQIESAIDSALQTAKTAEADNKPAFFKGGVKQRLDQADSLLSVYEAIKGKGDQTLASLDKKYQSTKAQIDAVEAKMAEQLLASVRAPQDAYTGSDAAKLRGMIEQEWKKLYPQDKILAIRLHSADWTRTNKLKWNNSGWYQVDTSVLPAKVIVKTDDTIATIYVAFINKDNLSGGKMNVGAKTKERGYVIEKMLLKNFK